MLFVFIKKDIFSVRAMLTPAIYVTGVEKSYDRGGQLYLSEGLMSPRRALKGGR